MSPKKRDAVILEHFLHKYYLVDETVHLSYPARYQDRPMVAFREKQSIIEGLHVVGVIQNQEPIPVVRQLEPLQYGGEELVPTVIFKLDLAAGDKTTQPQAPNRISFAGETYIMLQQCLPDVDNTCRGRLFACTINPEFRSVGCMVSGELCGDGGLSDSSHALQNHNLFPR